MGDEYEARDMVLGDETSGNDGCESVNGLRHLGLLKSWEFAV